jgi:hypothetical protein
MIICALSRIYYLLLEITITLLQSGFSPSSEPRSQALLRQQLRTLIEVALNPCPELLDLRLSGGEDLPTAKDPCGIFRIQNNCSCQS